MIRKRVTTFLVEIHIKPNSQMSKNETIQEMHKMQVLIFILAQIELKQKRNMSIISLKNHRANPK